MVDFAYLLISLTPAFVIVGILFALTRFTRWEEKREERMVLLYTDTLTRALTVLKDTQVSYNETIKEVQIEHFTSLEKQSQKQLSLLEKQARDFLKHMETKQEEHLSEKKEPQPIHPDAIENMIEKEELQDIPLAESARIPMVEGINIKFEDDETVFPIDIVSSQLGESIN